MLCVFLGHQSISPFLERGRLSGKKREENRNTVWGKGKVQHVVNFQKNDTIIDVGRLNEKRKSIGGAAERGLSYRRGS